jgi:predicted O-methyltransferase YrrM
VLGTTDPADCPDFVRTVFELNKQLATCGEKIEGNVCYLDQISPDKLVKSLPTSDVDHVKKRINLCIVARQSATMLEIGLNGGHSALLCLIVNPTLTLVAVDLFRHSYVKEAAQFLKERFPRRFHYVRGDSRDVLPRMSLERPKQRFDAIHVDGGHGDDVAYADVSNSLRLARQNALLVLDDMQAPWLANIFQTALLLGHFTRAVTDVFCQTRLHEIVRVA